jgi:hypothetical protein
MTDPLYPPEARFLVESTCELSRPYDEVVAYISEEWARGMKWGKRMAIAAMPLMAGLGQYDLIGELAEFAAESETKVRGQIIDAKTSAGPSYRFVVTELPHATQVRTIHYNPHRLVSFIPGIRSLSLWSLHKQEDRMRRWAASGERQGA